MEIMRTIFSVSAHPEKGCAGPKKRILRKGSRKHTHREPFQMMSGARSIAGASENCSFISSPEGVPCTGRERRFLGHLSSASLRDENKKGGADQITIQPSLCHDTVASPRSLRFKKISEESREGTWPRPGTTSGNGNREKNPCQVS